MFTKYEAVDMHTVYERVVEKCWAVLYHGIVQYLSNKERVAIISGNGPDYDIVPETFDGPQYKEVETQRRVRLEEPFFVIQEWDGSFSVVKVTPGPREGYKYYRWSTYENVTIEYWDGVTYTIPYSEFKLQTGVRPILEVVKEQQEKEAARKLRYIGVLVEDMFTNPNEDDTIPF